MFVRRLGEGAYPFPPIIKTQSNQRFGSSQIFHIHSTQTPKRKSNSSQQFKPIFPSLFINPSMASRNMTTFHSKPNYLFPSHNPIRNSDGVFQFDDSDLWVNPDHSAHDSKKMMMSSIPREPRRKTTLSDHQRGTTTVTSASLPVNIPDWSKIMKEQRKQRDTSDEDVNEEYEDGDADERVPPHEYLARNRGASFSVHEGVGRTLKGRDLRRVRNAIWKQVGFED